MRLREKLAWGLLISLGLFVMASTTGIVSGGSLDPPGPPESTMKSLDDIAGTWHRLLEADARCDRGRFICVMNGEAVLDHETGLVWQRDVSAEVLSWFSASGACQLATIGGRYGWRLPTIAEFGSLIDPAEQGARLPDGHPFTGLPTGTGYFVAYWTINVGVDATSAWRVNLADQQFFDPASTGASSTLRHWCVRGPSNDFNVTP